MFTCIFKNDTTKQTGGMQSAEAGLRDGRLYVRLYSVHRGGCLFAGTIEVYSLDGGYTRRTIESTGGHALSVTQGEISESLNAYLHSLCARFVRPLSEISATELDRFNKSTQYTPDEMVAAWYSK